MKATENDANPTNSQVNEKRWKKGEVHPETGLLFWSQKKGCKPHFVTPEKYAAYVEKGKESTKAWLERNKERHAATCKANYLANHEEEKAYRKRYYAENKEEFLKTCKAYRERTKEQRAAKNVAQVEVNRQTLPEKRWKRGDIHPETGLVFFQYHLTSATPERWVTQETLDRYREIKRVSALKRHYSDHEKSKSDRRTHYLKNVERERRQKRNWAKGNRGKLAIYQRKKMLTDHMFATKSRVRTRILQAIRKKGLRKGSKTEEIIGCDWPHFFAHLESLFAEGMNWENRSLWHIDHHIPLASAKTVDDIYRLCHYTNLRPLWAADNLSKKDTMPEEFYG